MTRLRNHRSPPHLLRSRRDPTPVPIGVRRLAALAGGSVRRDPDGRIDSALGCYFTQAT